jgi:hypothetical protein
MADFTHFAHGRQLRCLELLQSNPGSGSFVSSASSALLASSASSNARRAEILSAIIFNSESATSQRFTCSTRSSKDSGSFVWDGGYDASFADLGELDGAKSESL